MDDWLPFLARAGFAVKCRVMQLARSACAPAGAETVICSICGRMDVTKSGQGPGKFPEACGGP